MNSCSENNINLKLARGTVVGRYVIIELIGSGGMGSVYSAYDPKLNRGVALKFLSLRDQDLSKRKRAKDRLLREAQALARLSNPNVVAVHDVGEFGDDVFVAMELVEGQTLKEWLRESTHTITQALELMIAAGRGLSAAHKAGLIHRDFKPGNVIIGHDSRVRVLDFGLARAVDDTKAVAADSEDPIEPDWDVSGPSSENLLLSPLTRTGGILGTPLYMAPEQHRGQNTGERSDQYSFCLVLFQALYGQHPFPTRNLRQLRRRVTNEQFVIPADAPKVPLWLQRIVLKGLRADPDERYDSMDALLEELSTDPNIRF